MSKLRVSVTVSNKSLSLGGNTIFMAWFLFFNFITFGP